MASFPSDSEYFFEKAFDSRKLDKKRQNRMQLKQKQQRHQKPMPPKPTRMSHKKTKKPFHGLTSKELDNVSSKLVKRIDKLGDDLVKRISFQISDLGERISSIEERMSKRISKIDEKIGDIDQKLTLTTKQVKNIQSNLLMSSINYCIDCHEQHLQVGALARTSGHQIENIMRDKLHRMAEDDTKGFFYFSSSTSRSQAVWCTLKDACMYMHIDSLEEQNMVLRSCCSLITLDQLQAFIIVLLKDVQTPKETIRSVGCILQDNAAEALKVQLHKLVADHHEKSSKGKLLAVTDFLKLIGRTILKEQQLKEKMEALITNGLLTIKSEFLFMFLTWFSSKHLSTKKNWLGVIRRQLEIDGQGLCIRRGCTFVAGAAEMKASAGKIPYAKLQLRIVEALLSTLVGFLHGQLYLEKHILIYNVPEEMVEGRDNDDFRLCYFSEYQGGVEQLGKEQLF